MKRRIFILTTLIMIFSLTAGCSVEGNSNIQNNKLDNAAQQENVDISSGKQGQADSVIPDKVENGRSQVFMTTDISSKGLMKVYKALNRSAKGKVAIKLHMGEPGNNNYLSPELIRDLTISVNGTFVDSNTAYGGTRANTKAHLQVAKDHGFTYAPVDILDADGEVKIPINGGHRLKEASIGSHYNNYDFIISIAHFKGHGIAGFGGTFKNFAVGMASAEGKRAVHGGFADNDVLSVISAPSAPFLERVAEVSKAIIDDKRDNIVYINVLNNLSLDCDCDSNGAKPDMKDIGILASLDPVSLDKASVDLVYAAPDGKQLVKRIESKDGKHLLDYAEKLGIGSQKYDLVKLDD